jgi:hypothetical protein
VADIPFVDLSKVLSGIGNDPRLISVTAGENCPRDAGKLISECDCQHVAVKPLRCLLDPGPQSLPCGPWPPLEDERSLDVLLVFFNMERCSPKQNDVLPLK